MQTPRVPALDVLLLFAVLAVVLFHYGYRGPTGFGTTYVALPELGPYARYGFLGVPVFFVISGFVIAYSAEGRGPVQFAIARFARIYPTFVLCMTLTFAFLILFGAPAFETSFAQWVSNLLIAAPGSTYMDSAYWSLVVEMIFYTWVAIFIALGLWQTRLDLIVAVWLALSVLSDLTIDATVICKAFLADYSGFFATGIMMYQIHKGRRDASVQWLLATAVLTAVYQSIHNLRGLREQTGAIDDLIVAGIFLISVSVIFAATKIRRLPLNVALAVGGITYPLYLLHQQIGYVLFDQPTDASSISVAATLLFLMALSWGIWRFFEPSAQSLTKRHLTAVVERLSSSTFTVPSKKATP